MAKIETNLFNYEGNQDAVEKGELAFHNALYVLEKSVDPAVTFITYRFNRVGIKHDSLDSACYADGEGVPTLGINYAKLAQYPPIAQIGVIEHNIGHFMSGHVGNKLGIDMREYCETTHGKEAGSKLYYMTIETAADSYVTYPEQMMAAGIPYFDVRKLGLERWEYTLNILRKIEELADEIQADSGGDFGDALDSILNDTFGIPASGASDMDGETGGAPSKDVVVNNSRTNNSIVENNLRSIIKEAMARYPDKTRGFMAGDAGLFVQAEVAQPVVPWIQRLNHSVSSALSELRRVTRKRLNRRNPNFGFGRIHENTTDVVFVIDTSGSMDSADLQYVDAQLSFIAQAAENVHVIHCDAGVAKHEEYHRSMQLSEFFGRGGTSFEPALEYIRDNMDMPDAVVYFTDGYGGRLNDKEPIIGGWETRLIWVLTPSGYTEEQFTEHITKLGEVIKVDKWV